MQLHCRIGKALICHSAAQHRAENIIQKQKRHDIKQRADGSKGKHKPSQGSARPIPWRKGFLLIHIIPRQNNTQHIIQQIQQQNLQGGHWQKRQKCTGAHNGKDIAEIRACCNFNIFEHIGKSFSPLQNALLQHAQILLQQHHIRCILRRIHCRRKAQEYR